MERTRIPHKWVSETPSPFLDRDGLGGIVGQYVEASI